MGLGLGVVSLLELLMLPNYLWMSLRFNTNYYTKISVALRTSRRRSWRSMSRTQWTVCTAPMS